VSASNRAALESRFRAAVAAACRGIGHFGPRRGITSGTDGGTGRPDDPDPSHARRLGLTPAQYLDDNNSTEFFEKLADLPVPGPTLTNVNDFRAIVVDSA
jgi:hydroxypyruvate reductase